MGLRYGSYNNLNNTPAAMLLRGGIDLLVRVVAICGKDFLKTNR